MHQDDDGEPSVKMKKLAIVEECDEDKGTTHKVNSLIVVEKVDNQNPVVDAAETSKDRAATAKC